MKAAATKTRTSAFSPFRQLLDLVPPRCSLAFSTDEVNVMLPAEGLEIEQVIGWVSLPAARPVRVT